MPRALRSRSADKQKTPEKREVDPSGVVFGLDGDIREVFRRTVDWAVEAGITPATFHILTPYPGTALFFEMESRQSS